MGKRGPSAPVKARVAPKLDTTFHCLFCNHDNSVTVKINKRDGLGHLKCSRCPKTFVASVGVLEAPVDVYFKWVDACEEANKGPAEPEQPPPKRTRLAAGSAAPVRASRPQASQKPAASEVARGVFSDDEDDYKPGYQSDAKPALDDDEDSLPDLDIEIDEPARAAPRRRLRRERTPEPGSEDDAKSDREIAAPSRERRTVRLDSDSDSDI